jgi:hypothetical protein
MKDTIIELLLRKSSPAPEPRHDCPSEELFAAYVDGGLAGPDHLDLTAHFADCDFCLSRLGMLGRARDTDEAATVPTVLRARAGDLVRQPGGRHRFWKTAPGWAAAALVVLTTSLIFIDTDNRFWVSDSLAPAAERTSSETRTIEPLFSGPSLLWPREGIVLDDLRHEFSWTAVPGSLYYDLRIVRDDGDLVWQARVKEARWELPIGLKLQPGAEYYVRVDAWLTDSGSLSSDYVLFRYEASF